MTKAPIPQPKTDPLLGNLRDMDTEEPVQGLMRLARIYGPIFRLTLPGRSILIVSSQELVNELCDEKRFDKRVHSALQRFATSPVTASSPRRRTSRTGQRRTTS